MSSRCTKQDCEARQQDPDPSAVVRRTTPEVVRAPPDASICASQVLREQDRTSACARARRCRASIVPRTATHKAARKVAGKAVLLRVTLNKPLLHATGVSSGALWLRGRAGSAACAGECTRERSHERLHSLETDIETQRYKKPKK